MYGRRILRWAALLIALAAFAGTAAYMAWTEENSCMDVRFLRQEQRDPEDRYEYADLSRELEVDGEPAAVDVGTSTIYISRNILPETEANALPGSIRLTDYGYDLYFVEEEAFSDLASAVEAGHTFTLLAVSGNGTYMEYRVVFTTLPVMRLDGWFSHMSPTDREVMLGDVCLWSPLAPATGRHSVKASATEWHLRGGTTASQAKKPWKLSLEKEHRQNNDVEFLGMGADDDWILNAMYIDDTKMKENLFMQLWNTWQEQASWNHRMSTGEYVEVVINQSYAGIHLLQRRIDGKYLQLDEQTIILKGGPSFAPGSVAEAYEIVESPLTEEETYALMEDFFAGEDMSMLNLDNFLDVNLFLQYGAAVDNSWYKNMFYLLEKEADGYRLSLLPWDTDMSWGMVWVQEKNTGGYVYDYDSSMAKDASRLEYSYVKEHVPELDALLARRWQLLRQEVLTEEYILSLVEEMSDQFRRSGVLQRDAERWGTFFDGKDTEEMLKKFLCERLEVLDAYYGAFLEE